MEIKIFEDFEIMEGKHKVIISAPHAFIHMRDGEFRYGETMTDVLAKDIAEELNIYAIYKNISSDKDANYDKECDYKKECLKEVKRNKLNFLVDLHGMKMEREEDICLGTNNYSLLDGDTEIAEKIKNIFLNNGFKNVSIDIPFDAKRKECVSNFIHENANIKTLQIEINGKYRLPESPEFNYEGLKKSIIEVLNIFLKKK